MKVQDLIELLLKENQEATVLLSDWNEGYARPTARFAIYNADNEVILG